MHFGKERVSKRVLSISHFFVMEIMEKAFELQRRGIDVIHFEIGEPDLPIFPSIREEAKEALERDRGSYTESLGILELRRKICGYFEKCYGIKVEPDMILVTSGSSAAILVALATLIDVGDEVLIPLPHYPCYPNFVRVLGGEVRFFPMRMERGEFFYDKDLLLSCLTERTKAVILNSPQNPTGSIYSDDFLEFLSSFDLPIISDEIYQGLVYDEGDDRTALSVLKNGFLIGGFSKLYSMTGWRLGYLVGKSELVEAAKRVSQNIFISANSFVQKAAISALDNFERIREEAIRTYLERRDLLFYGLKDIGFSVESLPKGAFYLFVDAKNFTDDAKAFALDLLEEAFVAITPGIDFGEGFKTFVRFSYTCSKNDIKLGLERIKDYISKKIA